MDKFLIILPNWIGDYIMMLPALKKIKDLNPDTEITYVVKERLYSLTTSLNYADYVISYSDKFVDCFKNKNKFKNNYYSNIWVYPNSIRAHFIARCFIKGNNKYLRSVSNLFSFFQINKKYNFNIHQVTANDLFLNNENVLKDYQNTNFEFSSDIISKFKLTQDYICIAPGASRGESKRWPKESFVKLVKEVSSKKQVIILGSSEDIELCKYIAKKTDAISLAGKTSILEWIAIIKYSSLLISNDSGGMHLASLLKIPQIAIFGNTDPKVTGPIGKKALVIKKSKVSNRKIRRDLSRNSLNLISVNDILESINKLID